ncbi:MAG TPA: TldD/PmbA family protein [Gemmatimonadaceae bacterium]|jgi:predicted Zn-dependent protease|nr:TldD/PmbA family protein [Gemmatimonadaceae bacterium]
MTIRSLLTTARYLSREECEAITKKALTFSHADEARVLVSSTNISNTRFAVNQISTGGDAFDSVVTVISKFGKRSGSAATNQLDDAGLRAAVEMSERVAKLSPEDPEGMPELEPQTYRPGVNWSDATASLDPAARADAVKRITEPAKAAGLVSTGFMEAITSAQAIANSKGLFAYNRSTASVLTTTVRTSDGTGSGWAGATHHDWTKIDPSTLGARATDKARRSVNAVAVEPGRYTVVFEPTAAGNLVQFIGRALSARAADEGRSFFSASGGKNKIGQKVVDERVTIVSDPFDPNIAGAPFSGDGLPTKPVVWIENGVLKNLDYDRYWAQKQQRAPTGAGGSIGMTGGTSTMDDLIRSTERGLLVTRFWYLRPVDQRTILYTGLTRDGTFLIENGKVTKPVKNMRFNDSPIFMLNNLEAMGAPVRVSASEGGEPGQAIAVPPIKVRDFSFTSLSDAV